MSKMQKWIVQKKDICSPKIIESVLSIDKKDGLLGCYDSIVRADWFLFGIMDRSPALAIEIMRTMLEEFSVGANEKQRRQIGWLAEKQDLSEKFEEKINIEKLDHNNNIVIVEIINRKSKKEHIKDARKTARGKVKRYYLNRATHFLTKILNNEINKPANMASAFVVSIVQHLKENDVEAPELEVLTWFKRQCPYSRWAQTFDHVSMESV